MQVEWVWPEPTDRVAYCIRNHQKLHRSQFSKSFSLAQFRSTYRSTGHDGVVPTPKSFEVDGHGEDARGIQEQGHGQGSKSDSRACRPSVAVGKATADGGDIHRRWCLLVATEGCREVKFSYSVSPEWCKLTPSISLRFRKTYGLSKSTARRICRLWRL
jgi:hypothetical protein